MKLSKNKARKGWYITCHVGQCTYTSWWTSPPNSIDHVDIGYLKDRYACITTQNRVTRFKSLFKVLMKDEEGIKYE